MESVICDLYCRVSTTEQAQEGYSIGEQEERLRKYAEAHGWIINQCYVDGGFSGAKLERPGIQQVIKDCQKHLVNKVVVYRLDRLSRSQKDTLYLIEEIFLKNGVDFVSMTETLDTGTAFGMAMIGILSVFAQLERETIKERMQLGLDARIKSGEFRGYGKRVIGYDYDPTTGKLTQNEYDAMMVRKVFQMYASGSSMWNIAKYLNELHWRKDWEPKHVKKILEQPLYIGLQRWKGEISPVNDCPNIIDRDLWDSVQRLLSSRNKNTYKPQTPGITTSLLSGIIWCGECGKRFYSFSGRNNVHRYACSSREASYKLKGYTHCGNRSFTDYKLEEIVFREIKELKTKKPKSSSKISDEKNSEVSALNNRLKLLDAQQSKLIDLYMIGSINKEEISKRSKSIQAEADSIKKKIESIKNPSAGLTSREVDELIENIDDYIENADHDALYILIHQLIQSITINGDDIRINWNFSI